MNNTETTLLIFTIGACVFAVTVGVLYGRAGDRIDRLIAGRDNSADEITRLQVELYEAEQRLDKAHDQIGELRQGARNERTNARRLSQELNQARAENEAVALTRPATPMPGEIRAVIETAESILRGVEGGEQRA